MVGTYDFQRSWWRRGFEVFYDKLIINLKSSGLLGTQFMRLVLLHVPESCIGQILTQGSRREDIWIVHQFYSMTKLCWPFSSYHFLIDYSCLGFVRNLLPLVWKRENMLEIRGKLPPKISEFDRAFSVNNFYCCICWSIRTSVFLQGTTMKRCRKFYSVYLKTSTSVGRYEIYVMAFGRCCQPFTSSIMRNTDFQISNFRIRREIWKLRAISCQQWNLTMTLWNFLLGGSTGGKKTLFVWNSVGAMSKLVTLILTRILTRNGLWTPISIAVTLVCYVKSLNDL